jgi:hypothetical protein
MNLIDADSFWLLTETSGGILGSRWVGEFRWLWHLEDMVKKFGAVYYNFPHAGVVQGFFDGHPFVRILANERRLCHIPRLGTDFPTIGPVVFWGVTIVAAAKNVFFSLFFKAALLQCVVIVGLLSFQCLMCRSTLAVKSSLQLQLLCSTIFHSFWMLHSYPHRIFTLRHNLVHPWDIPRDIPRDIPLDIPRDIRGPQVRMAARESDAPVLSSPGS